MMINWLENGKRRTYQSNAAKKERKGLELIYRFCQTNGIPEPKVNFSGCPEDQGNQLAHYHPKEHKICISEIQLRKYNKNLYDLDNTISHEMTHFFLKEHGSHFENVKNQIRVENWRPPQNWL